MARTAVNKLDRPVGGLDRLVELVYPPRCRLCGDRGLPRRDLCAPCQSELPWLVDACPRCALPLTGAPGLPCGFCLRRPPPVDHAHAALHYTSPLDRIVQDFKFHGQLAAGRLLGDLLTDHLVLRQASRPDLIVPVPLHPRRLRERGFNQSLELARPIGKRLHLPLRSDLLVRTGATATQHELPANKRRSNVRGAFAVTRALFGLNVAVVDDVMTTGYTTAEIARTLRRAGARRVDVWVVARALLDA